MTSIHPSLLLQFLGESKAAAMGSDKAEVRSLSFIVFSLFFYQLIEPGFYIIFIDESLTHKVAMLSHAKLWLGFAFFATAAMVLPHLANLVFFPKRLDRRWPRKMAARASVVAALLWGYLAYRAWPLDYEWLSAVWLVRMVVDLYLGVLLGISLNAQQAREAYEKARAQQEAIEQQEVD